MSLILLSGGLDSATALAWALKTTPKPHQPISFVYGQRHDCETQAAIALCLHYGLPIPEWFYISDGFRTVGGSSLLSGVAGKNPSAETANRPADGLPSTFVPGRNMIFLAYAASYAYVHGHRDIVGGWNSVDYSGYPDCRHGFLRSMTETANLALGLWDAETMPANVASRVPPLGLMIHAPLLSLSKSNIISMGELYGVPWGKTWSCYAGGASPCGQCDSCKIRAAGFSEAGVIDGGLK